MSYFQNLRHILTIGYAAKLFISCKWMLWCTLLCQKTFNKSIHNVYSQQTLHMYVIYEYNGPGPLKICLQDLKNLAYLQTFYNRPMLMSPGLFEMCPSLGDYNTWWHSPISPLLLRQWSDWSYGSAVSTTFKLHHLLRPEVDVFVPPRIDFWICPWVW